MAPQTLTRPEQEQSVERKIQPDYLDIIDSAWDGGIRSPGAKDYLVKHQITAEGWYVAYPDLTVAEIKRLQRVGKAVDELLDKIGG